MTAFGVKRSFARNDPGQLRGGLALTAAVQIGKKFIRPQYRKQGSPPPGSNGGGGGVTFAVHL